MGYHEELSKIASEYRRQIEVDLSSARQEYENAHAALGRAERHIQLVEGLLAMGAGRPNDTNVAPVHQMTLHAAMHQVLKDSPAGRMRAGEMVAEIARRGLYRMRDGRPPETQQIHARAGHYPDMFGKDGPFFFPR
jgi:hypothetical protein